MQNFWSSCLTKFQSQLSAQQFDLWIKPLKPIDFKNGELILEAPSRFVREEFKKHYERTVINLATKDFPSFQKLTIRITKTSPAKEQENVAKPKTVAQSPEKTEEEPLNLSRVNQNLTFENFVTGRANQMAHAAALHVANSPKISYNPLYLVGGVGLGKTHLMHAIGNAIIQKQPEAKIRYIHARQFLADFVAAAKNNQFEQFSNYYQSLDILLIDDIQFIASPGTMASFFDTFEALITSNKQIVISCDTYPKKIKNMDDRLISRFDSGLTVTIDPPELEMRVAILMKKAEAEQITLPNEVAFYVATQLKSNVRELEGALKKILAFSRFCQAPISIDSAKNALKDIVDQKKFIAIEDIQKTVADYYNIKVAEILSKKRPAKIAKPRQIAMYLAKELTKKSLPDIGESFGGRDHTTVLHAVKKITEERLTDPELNQDIHILIQTLKE